MHRPGCLDLKNQSVSQCVFPFSQSYQMTEASYQQHQNQWTKWYYLQSYVSCCIKVLTYQTLATSINMAGFYVIWIWRFSLWSGSIFHDMLVGFWVGILKRSQLVTTIWRMTLPSLPPTDSKQYLLILTLLTLWLTHLCKLEWKSGIARGVIGAQVCLCVCEYHMY